MNIDLFEKKSSLTDHLIDHTSSYLEGGEEEMKRTETHLTESKSDTDPEQYNVPPDENHQMPFATEKGAGLIDG